MVKTAVFSLVFATFGVAACFRPAWANPTCSSASHYGIGDGFHGATTASGEVFDAYDFTAAHRTLPFGTKVRVRNVSNLKTVVVRINDRGPFIPGRNIDLSYAAFSQLAHPDAGVINVCFERLSWLTEEPSGCIVDESRWIHPWTNPTARPSVGLKT